VAATRRLLNPLAAALASIVMVLEYPALIAIEFNKL
jgi:hypothetical protein